ncbi:tRNA (adenosine(37)-N6)-threonylcarbamoyltransferase complex ATPase subunit type 1 TsaE [Pontimicrobium aquaticum]|uniref:tRNA threonylcarbamoyladenosine biosynthesis protein TsaE n=1 Tax=Pontimicrobium aquaticum TaxID=2565367 RepID=A0A4U0EP81_9FLAO|nr:tRNA (adenosine(37)-N6)-threonylcarbamoyltransferase complex ATPase subunit type 1 TsaE [Pontimicrobium aquaticum]TJY33426.1 tRNA (adenosine(37)-N6)-threonylcarbamoyltransferase complex ATPase subunit type 1 TsaE [Pontimicrobium aquaticum]
MKTIFDIQSIDNVAKELLANAKHKTILFYGDMGVGKTTLISALVKALGGTDETSSPTFSIVNEYKVNDDIVYHFDFYRINDETEVLDIGIEDYFYSGHWNFIEWPEKIEGILPNEADISYIKMNNDGSRTLELGVFGKK